MKPWEETWVAHKDCVVDEPTWKTVFVIHEDSRVDLGYEGADRWLNRERAQLVSAAPDMARVLLEMEWRGFPLPRIGNEECATCVGCGDRRPSHKPSCMLDAALRKAGVR